MEKLARDLPSPGNLINGNWVDGTRAIAVLDKYSQQPFAHVSEASSEHVHKAIGALSAGLQKVKLPPHERARVLFHTADLVEKNRDRFREIIVAETAFTVSDAMGEIDRAIVTLRLSAEEATRLVGEVVPFGANPGQHERIGFTIRVPRGIVCAITPFNSPLNTVLHKVAPALAGGNAVLLKPSTYTPLTAALLCELLLEAGLPPELLALLHGSGETVGSLLLEQQEIAFYTFTGSTRVGRVIQRAAGLRRTQLELGSIASTIVCKDADLERAVPKIANASFRKAGQVCTSIQRLYVSKDILEPLTERLVEATRGMKLGDPRDAATKVGPMIATSAAERAESWIEEALSKQGRALIGGSRAGAMFEPTVLADVGPGMRVVDEEIFAPVVCLLAFENLEDAVAGANGSPYGLAAGLFTRDINQAFAAAKSLRFGTVHINETSSSRADGMPFGGVKDSGFGHEGPKYAIREMTEERLLTITP